MNHGSDDTVPVDGGNEPSPPRRGMSVPVKAAASIMNLMAGGGAAAEQRYLRGVATAARNHDDGLKAAAAVRRVGRNSRRLEAWNGRR